MTAIGSAAGVILRYTLRWGKWIVLVIALVYTAISVGVANLGTPGEATSVWASAMWVLQWIAFPGGIAVGYGIPLLVAHGLTRRTATLAGTLAVLVLALAAALLVQLGLTAEWLIYRATGMPYQLDGGHLFRAVGEVHLVLAEHTLSLGSFLISGLLLYLVYYRLGGRWGTLAVPVALVPPAGAAVALALGWAGPSSPSWAATIGPAPALVLALVPVGAGLLAVWLLTRTMPIRST